jgi:hypothetical protein
MVLAVVNIKVAIHMELVVDMAVVIMEVVEEVTVAALEMVDTEVELIEILYHLFLLSVIGRPCR